MKSKEPEIENLYRIQIQGVLDRTITDWFGELTILPQENGETVLVGPFADQSALRGLLDQLWNLNFTLLSVERLGRKNYQQQ
jgi:hypothetical protein